MATPNSDEDLTAPPRTGNALPAQPPVPPAANNLLNQQRATLPIPAATLNGQTPRNKLKRFRFIETYDLYLLKAVRSTDAHLPDWGKAEALYDEALKLFLRDVPGFVFTQSQKPSSKTLSDRFKRLVARRRTDVKQNAAASGIIENYGEKEILLDDLIMEIDQKEEATRAEKEVQTENEKRLVAAGENIRVMALKRSRSDSDDAEGNNGARNSAKKARILKTETAHSDEEITTAMIKRAAARSEMEKSRLDLERERTDMERKRAEGEAARFEKLQEATNRRLDLDDKRFELEKEERKQSLAERKKMLDVMNMLCKKLG